LLGVGRHRVWQLVGLDPANLRLLAKLHLQLAALDDCFVGDPGLA